MQTSTAAKGLGISQSAARLRNYVAVERARLKILAGWFLRIGDYDTKHKLGYHLYDASEHLTGMLARLAEMRGGNPSASVRPELKSALERFLHAPSDRDFLSGFYGALTRTYRDAVDHDLRLLDPSGNANEVRLLSRIRVNLQDQLDWFETRETDASLTPWAERRQRELDRAGGLHGEQRETSDAAQPTDESPRFERPATIRFDGKITVGELQSYERRLALEAREATIEQFKVFFNEFYAAALLASILYDASDADYPWEFFADFSRHFWDEVRHSEFGAIRLRELGVEPDRVNPVLFEESQGLPVLHRVVYLTRGLEGYFMPRKPKRMKEYQERGDARSQLFADQDWSDEINHVRYGTKWSDYLLENDYREIGDIIEEVKAHLSQLRGRPVTDISAPF